MRFVYAGIGVIGGLLSVAAVYLFFTFAMFMGGGSGAVGKVLLYVIGACLIAALLNVVAGCMHPREAIARRLLLISAAIWPLGGLLLGFLKYADPASTVSLVATVKFVALLAVPAVLPLAAYGFARWKFEPAP
jgi:hypothetical protein